jgi:hypothetical protein
MAKNETSDATRRIEQLETRINDLERSLQDERTRRILAEAKYDGYSSAVKDLGRRDSNGGEHGGYGMFPFHPMMFRRPY